MANSGTIASLNVQLGLDSAEFRRGLSSAERRMGETARRMKRAAAGLAAVSVAISAVAVRVGANIDAQAKLARSLGTTTASMQKMERAGELAGVSMSGIEQATKDLTRRLSQAASGTGPAVEALSRLNLSAHELMGMDLDERVEAINSAILEFIPAAERAAVAGQLFGEEGSIAMSRLDPATIRQAADEVERMGLAIGQADASAIEKANDQISKLQLVLKAAGQQIALAVLPALGRMADALATAFEKGKALRGVFDFITEGLSGRVVAYATALGGVTAAFVGLRFAVMGVSAALAGLKAAMVSTGIGALVVVAGELLYRFAGLSSGGTDLADSLSVVDRAARAQVESAKRLNEQLSGGAALTRDTAESMLSLARAKQADLEATVSRMKVETEARIKASEEYQTLMSMERALADLRAKRDERATNPVVLEQAEKVRAAVEAMRLPVVEAEAALNELNARIAELGTGSTVEPLRNVIDATAQIRNVSYPAAESVAELAQRYGPLATAAKRAADAQRDLAVAQSMGQARAMIQSITALTGGLSKSKTQAIQLNDALVNMRNAETPEQMARAFGRVTHLINAASGGVQNMSDETRQLYNNAAQVTAALVGAANAADAGRAATNGFTKALAYTADVARQVWGNLRGAAGALGGLARGLGSIASAIPGLEAARGALGGLLGAGRSLAGNINWGRIRSGVSGIGAEMRRLATTAPKVASSLGSSSGGVARAAREASNALSPAAEAAKDLADTFKNGLSSAIDGVGDAFGELFTGGIKSFKDFADKIWSGFKSLIAKMISAAIANPIKLSLGLIGGAGQGGAGSGGIGGGLISGAVSKALGSWGGSTGILGGLGSVFSGFKAGGLSGAFSGIGAAFKAGPLAGIGAALPIVGLGVALFSAFRTKTKELDAGIDVHLQGLNATAQKWQKLQKSVLFGLVKWKSNKTSAADAAFTSPIQQAYREMQESTREVAKLAGAHAGVLDNFAASFNLSTKGKSAEQVQQEIQKWVAGINDQLARTILAQGNGFDLTHLIRQGEGASVTLKALAASMQVMRTTFGELGLSMRGFSNDLLGANLARTLLDQNGGAEAFTAAADVYLQNFYSPMERAGKLADKMRASLGQVGIRELPTTMGRLRELTEYFAGIGYAEQAARLVSLAPMFTEWKRLSDEMAEGANAAAEQSRKAAEDAAKAAKKAADDAAAEIRRIRGDYSLDSGKYRTEAEAKLAFEMENRGKHSGEKLDAQNALLREIRDLLNRQASTADFALARS